MVRNISVQTQSLFEKYEEYKTVAAVHTRTISLIILLNSDDVEWSLGGPVLGWSIVMIT